MAVLRIRFNVLSESDELLSHKRGCLFPQEGTEKCEGFWHKFNTSAETERRLIAPYSHSTSRATTPWEGFWLAKRWHKYPAWLVQSLAFARDKMADPLSGTRNPAAEFSGSRNQGNNPANPTLMNASAMETAKEGFASTKLHSRLRDCDATRQSKSLGFLATQTCI